MKITIYDAKDFFRSLFRSFLSYRKFIGVFFLIHISGFYINGTQHTFRRELNCALIVYATKVVIFFGLHKYLLVLGDG